MIKNNILKWKPFFKWPSGREKAILSLDLNIKNFCEDNNLPLIRHKDDLDWYFSTFFHLDDLGLVQLIIYDNSPVKSVIANVDFDVTTEKAIISIKNVLNVDEKKILWEQSEI